MKAIRQFLSEQRFLIADDSTASRIAMARALSELGMPASQMNLADSMDWAKELLSRHPFTGVICEYDLGKECGLELLNQMTDLKLSVVVSKNRSEIAAARAAEHDADVFLAKPFTIESLKNALSRAIEQKIGVTAPEGVRGPLEQVQFSHERKLEYDRIGYRSLVGLHEALMSQGQKEDAYAVLKRLVLGFPLNPQRLNTALRLAVETRNFEDMEAFHAVFLKVDHKSDELVKHVSAALVLAGKQCLRAGELEKALEHFQKAAVSSGRRVTFLKQIVLALVEAGQASQADAFLMQFSQREKDGLDYLSLDYLVLFKLRPLHEALRRGRELLRAGHHDPLIYQVHIEACARAKHLGEAESLVLDASRLWPERGPGFQALLNPTPAREPAVDVTP